MVAAAAGAMPIELDITALYQREGQFIARTLLRLTGDGAHVDDLLQETFIVAWKKRAGFDETRANARTWLYGIAANLARRHRRSLFRLLRAKDRLALEPLAAGAQPDEELERRRKSALVHAALDKLAFKQREVFVLYELEGLEGPAIAEMVGAPIGTVWTRLHHARKRFTELVQAEVTR